jgi:hypothetical protein
VYESIARCGATASRLVGVIHVCTHPATLFVQQCSVTAFVGCAARDDRGGSRRAAVGGARVAYGSVGARGPEFGIGTTCWVMDGACVCGCKGPIEIHCSGTFVAQPYSGDALRAAYDNASLVTDTLLRANDADDYEHLLAALAARGAVEVPVSWRAHPAPLSSAKDQSRLQAQRDIERDSVVVDGVRIVGTVGYAAVVAAISRAAAAAEVACGLGLGIRDELPGVREEFEGFAASILAAGNRTTSGGDSVEIMSAFAGLLCPALLCGRLGACEWCVHKYHMPACMRACMSGVCLGVRVYSCWLRTCMRVFVRALFVCASLRCVCVHSCGHLHRARGAARSVPGCEL